MSTIKVSSIAAMAQNRVIGNKDKIPWHIPEDFRFFKKTTMGHPMIMGRKTFESLPGVLKGRMHIVISRSDYDRPDAIGVTSLEQALKKAKELARQEGKEEVFIIGGGEIYRQAFPLTERLYLTVIHQDYEGDARFPDFDWVDWDIIQEERHQGLPAFTFYTLERKSR